MTHLVKNANIRTGRLENCTLWISTYAIFWQIRMLFKIKKILKLKIAQIFRMTFTAGTTYEWILFDGRV